MKGRLLLRLLIICVGVIILVEVGAAVFIMVTKPIATLPAPAILAVAVFVFVTAVAASVVWAATGDSDTGAQVSTPATTGFEEIRIVGVDRDKSQPLDNGQGQGWNVHFLLSATPIREWRLLLDREQGIDSRFTSVDRNYIISRCQPTEIQAELEALKKCVAAANEKCVQYFQEETACREMTRVEQETQGKAFQAIIDEIDFDD